MLFGGHAFRINATDLRQEFRRDGALQHLLLRYVFALITQSSQLAVCNQHHPIEQRARRFLGCVFDRTEGTELFLTHERLGRMIGVRRESITEVALRLQQPGAIYYSRGHITLMNRKKLDEPGCGCGTIIRNAFAAVSV